MIFHTITPKFRTLLLTLIALGLTMAMACQSSPDTTQDPAPSEPSTAETHHEEPEIEESAVDVEELAHDAEITDQHLEEFADALEAVILFQENNDLEEQMNNVTSQEEMHQVQTDFMNEMEAQVEASGMSLHNYMVIAQRIEQEPELEQKLQAKLEARGVSIP